MSTQSDNLTAIANAIRTQEGSTALIQADTFAQRILDLAVGETVTDVPTPASPSTYDEYMTQIANAIRAKEGSSGSISAAEFAGKILGLEDTGSLPAPGKALNDYTWEEISQISAAGLGPTYFNVGDTKTITLNGTIGIFSVSNLAIDAFIIGFDHNQELESPGEHRIHWQFGKINGTMVGLCDSNYDSTGSSGGFRMNISSTNKNGWAGGYMYILLGNKGTPTSPAKNSFMAALPSDLLGVMKSVNKYSDNGADSNGIRNVTATTDYLFLLSEFEVFGTRNYANRYEKNSQAQYVYYADGNSKKAYKHDSVNKAVWWWLRSAYYANEKSFLIVTSGGDDSYSTAEKDGGLRPCFTT